MTEVMVFNNPEFGEVRSVTINNEPWFVGKDVCEAFGDTNYRRSLSRLEDFEKSTAPIKTKGGMQEMTIVNESGLYSLMFTIQPQKGTGTSDTPLEDRIARLKAFKQWVTVEVLPSIRKTGSYAVTEVSSKDDYGNIDNKSRIAQLIIDCPNEKLPYVLKLFNIEEIPVPVLEKPYFRYGERLDRFNTIKELMIEKGVKPAEFAKMMGYPKSTMHNYMHNYSVPSLQRCDDMMRMLEELN